MAVREALRIAVDITHPAHFHFFRNAIVEWRERGHAVLLLSRDKDLTLQLLDETGWEHHCLSKVRVGLAGLAVEMVQHSLGVWQHLRRHRAQVVAAIGGTFIAHPARVLRIPSLVFYDTENAKLSNRMTYPAATRIYTPRAYRDDLGPKHVRYNGYHELAYLHPRRFTPDPSRLVGQGITPGEPYTFVRLVAWQSHHDIGDYGVRQIHRVVERLSQFGRVLVSSEAALPADLQAYAYRGAVQDVHHFLAYAQLTFGESATMASESAMLGVPSIFISTSSRGYTDEQQQKYGMVFNFNGDHALEELALQQAQAILSDSQRSQTFADRRRAMLADMIDVTDLVVNEVEAWARGR
jgi:hypothetical protein